MVGAICAHPDPIDLKISGQGVEAGPLMDVLVPTAHRWKSADFDLPSLSVLSRIPTDSLKFLERVLLRIRSADGRQNARVKAFYTAERLRRVVLTTQRTSQLLMPWSQLTEITVTDPSPQHCLDTLVQCMAIVSAKFQTGAWAMSPDLSQRPITTLARLKDLSISVTSTTNAFITPFFVCLALPALKILKLDLTLEQVWSSAEFTQFQLRSPNIERLELNRELDDDTWAGGPIDPPAQLAILQHAPLLVKLFVDHCMDCFDDSIVGALQYSATQTVHLALKLKVLSLSYAASINFDEDALDAMIQSRWWTDEQLLALPSPPEVARWSTIRIEYGDDDDDNVSPEFKAKLEEYRSQG
ncbi:hypothetical protein B0H12DRAFT_434592 [Mycena haematopus]|nr:hypothetical protein B0H12DRAFT_434592 [Mycena haematopus]